ncbi:MAG: hypothetical protein IJQ35_09825 [Bacteroidales bacterium]|jgi:hypothetical protein|nr:hypothetical protein [Bacteroidales bacterium]
MKRIEDIEKLSAEDLLRIGADESVPLPEDLQVRLPRPGRTVRGWSIAAAAAVMVGIAGWSLSRPAEPKDTFDDPYLAYAAVEQALMKTSAKMQAAAQKVYETENVIDQLTYWK